MNEQSPSTTTCESAQYHDDFHRPPVGTITSLADSIPPIRLDSFVLDIANCKQDVVRTTITQIPKKKGNIPLALFFKPFDGDEQTVRLEKRIPRCQKCLAHIHPFINYVSESCWQCNFCDTINPLPISKKTGNPVICGSAMAHGSVDFPIRNKDEAAPKYFFLLDTSGEALATGYLPLFCNALLCQLGQLASNAQIGFITYNSEIHLYKQSRYEENGPLEPLTLRDMRKIAAMVDVVTDNPEDYMLNIYKYRTAIADLLQDLPKIFKKPDQRKHHENVSALGAALTVAESLASGGRITVVQGSRPNAEPGKLREPPSQRLFDTFFVSSPNSFYREKGIQCRSKHVTVDLFLLGDQYMELNTLIDVAQHSGGKTFRFRDMHTSESDLRRFHQTLQRYLAQKNNWNAQVRIYVQKGMKITQLFGHKFNGKRVGDDPFINLTLANKDTNFGFEVSMKNLPPELIERACFQVAIKYWTPEGQRTRLHTLAIPISNDLPIEAIDQQCLSVYLGKLTAERLSTDERQTYEDIQASLTNGYNNILLPHREPSWENPLHRLAKPLINMIPYYGSKSPPQPTVAPKDELPCFTCYMTSIINSIPPKDNQSEDDYAYFLEQWRALPVAELISPLKSQLYAAYISDDSGLQRHEETIQSIQNEEFNSPIEAPIPNHQEAPDFDLINFD